MKVLELNINTLSGYTYFIDGQDSYWRSEALKFFYALVPEENRDFNLKILDNLTSLSDISDALNTVSMFDGAMVIVVKDNVYKEKAEEKGAIKDIIANIPQDTYLVFVGVQFITPQLKSKMTVIDATVSDAPETRKVINKLCDNNIEYGAVNTLMEYTNRDMQRISLEILKLRSYANGKQITEKMVKDLVENTVENEVYEFTNALASKNNVTAMAILDRFLENGVSYVYLLASLTGQYRRMLHAVLSNKSEQELAKYLGIKEFAVKKAREIGKKYTKMALKNNLDALVNAEYSFKSGEMSDETAFKTTIAKMLM